MKKYIIELKNGEQAIIIDTPKNKLLKSENYNFIFNKSDGLFLRWGKTQADDADTDLGLPEIADIEVSTICNGVKGICKFCYKENNPRGQNMSLETFSKVMEKLPPTVTQVALGIGNIDSHPELWDIMDYCRGIGVIPNITINGSRMTPELFDKLTSRVGACAVSKYDKDTTYNTIKELTDRGLKQTNMHFMLSEETFDDAMQTLKDIKEDERLKQLNAIVFLSLKTKGCAKSGFKQLSQEKFTELVKFAMDSGVQIGFDSCGSSKFLKAIEGHKHYAQMESMVEKCEASIYSSYISVDGDYYPCSFCETDRWEKGISVLECNDFLKDIWYNEKTLDFNTKLRSCNRDCPIYEI
jgi:MoaA/NifB/PqqE/SkfB family radical SAM enzyme